MRREFDRRRFLQWAIAFGLSAGGAGLLRGSQPDLSQNTFTGALKTGIYSEDALLRLHEMQPRVAIDSRIGVVHIEGGYPDIGPDFYNFGLDVAYNLGFRTVEVEFSGSEIGSKYRVPTRTGTTLADIAESPVFSSVFRHKGLKNIIITTESSNNNVLTAWHIGHDSNLFTPNRLQANYDEFHGFAAAVQEKYGNNGQKIIIQFPNELDWKLLADQKDRISEDAPDFAVRNAVALFDTRIQAIRDANEKYNNRRPLQTSIEVNRVLDALKYGKIRAVNAVLPRLKYPPDIVAYSSYEAAYDPEDLKLALDFIKQFAPYSQRMVSEFGIPENESGKSSGEIKSLVEKNLKVAFDCGVKHFIYWALLDNECKHLNPSSDECNGYWMVRPDGSLSDAYDVLSQHRA